MQQRSFAEMHNEPEEPVADLPQVSEQAARRVAALERAGETPLDLPAVLAQVAAYRASLIAGQGDSQ